MEQALKAEIARLKNDTTISPLLKKWLIARYERCLKKLIGLIALEIVKTDGDGREHAITYLSNQELFSHKIMAYSLIAESGDYTRAENYLTTLPTSSTGESDFVAAQYLFLDFITQGKVFVLTNQQKSSLEDIARGLRMNGVALQNNLLFDNWAKNQDRFAASDPLLIQETQLNLILIRVQP